MIWTLERLLDDPVRQDRRLFELAIAEARRQFDRPGDDGLRLHTRLTHLGG
jgi:hypothetical protein